MRPIYISHRPHDEQVQHRGILSSFLSVCERYLTLRKETSV